MGDNKNGDGSKYLFLTSDDAGLDVLVLMSKNVILDFFIFDSMYDIYLENNLSPIVSLIINKDRFILMECLLYNYYVNFDLQVFIFHLYEFFFSKHLRIIFRFEFSF